MLPNLEDVARAAGVAISTVSRALRNNPRIPETTRRRIRAIADRMGYRRLPAFAALGTRRKNRRSEHSAIPVALIEHATRTAGRPPLPLVEALGAELAAAGFRLDRVAAEELGRNPANALYSRGYGGVILFGFAADDPRRIGPWGRVAAEGNPCGAPTLRGPPRLPGWRLMAGAKLFALWQMVTAQVPARSGRAPERIGPSQSHQHGGESTLPAKRSGKKFVFWAGLNRAGCRTVPAWQASWSCRGGRSESERSIGCAACWGRIRTGIAHA